MIAGQPQPRTTLQPAGLPPVAAPAPAQETVLFGTKTKEQLAAEMRAAEAAESNLVKAEQLEGAHEAVAVKEQEVLTGKDLEFDVAAFIQKGVIRKENLKLMDGYFVDMQSLTKRDRIVADQLVKAEFGNLSVMDNAYNSTLESAIVAMAITRVNNKSYPLPDTRTATADPKTFQARFDAKRELFNIVLDIDEKVDSLLSMIYTKLDNADVLMEVKDKVDVAKK